jgi:hypothetical protein
MINSVIRFVTLAMFLAALIATPRSFRLSPPEEAGAGAGAGETPSFCDAAGAGHQGFPGRPHHA